MDPNACLAELRWLLTDGIDDDGHWKDASLADRAAELMEALDSWLSRGGFLPRSWEEARRKAGHPAYDTRTPAERETDATVKEPSR